MSKDTPSEDEVKSVIDEKTNLLKTYHIDPLTKDVKDIQTRTTKEAIQSIVQSCFSQKLKEDEFRNKVFALFNEKLKEETFINKVGSIADGKIKQGKQDAIVRSVLWVGGGALLAIIGGLVQKGFAIF